MKHLLPLLLGTAFTILVISCKDEPSSPTPAIPEDPLRPDGPVLLEPGDGARLGPPFRFTWQPADTFRSYYFCIMRGENDPSAVVQLVHTSECEFRMDRLAAAERYYWRVGGKLGSDTIWSVTRSFVLKDSMELWKSCTVFIAGVIAHIDVVRTSDSGTAVSTTQASLNWSREFARDSGAANTFSGEGKLETGPQAATWWSLRAFFNETGTTLDSVECREGSYVRRDSGPVRTSEYSVKGFAGKALGIKTSGNGVFRIDDPVVLASKFSYEWGSSASHEPRAGSDWWSLKQTANGFSIASGASIVLRFR